jgi:hypothetical protein
MREQKNVKVLRKTSCFALLSNRRNRGAMSSATCEQFVYEWIVVEKISEHAEHVLRPLPAKRQSANPG